ncbi:sulfotransferase family protein [Dinoroseobacter sp. S375]|uniref:sulfotransferase family protein n=1 Tax=Dinoroseobacter sp. S375 TaxID=3415136 RepID=UPI003C797A83
MRPRYVFVGGLHRSGTSLVARSLARHRDVSGITHAPVPEQEGVYLQGAIPHTARHGIPGAFAEDPAQHLTEESRFNTAEVAARLSAEWAPWFAPSAPWRIEKSPVNLLRSRLYQQLFPASQFVFVIRHPVACCRATAKWSLRSEAELLAHWGRAHRLLLDDLPYLHNAIVLRYEDFCAAPDQMSAQLARFLDLAPRDFARTDEEVLDRNAGYLSMGGAPLPDVARAFGYTETGQGPLPPEMQPRHMLARIRTALSPD